MRLHHLILLLFAGILLTMCKKDVVDLPVNDIPPHWEYNPVSFTPLVPQHFPPMQIPEENPMTVEGVELGRKLYYDPLLSTGGPLVGMSCSSCHLQEYGFTVPGTNVLPHVNLAWNTHFLWNGKIKGSLEDVMVFEVRDFFETDVSVIQNHETYPELFFNAFGVANITTENIAFALAQFFRTQISGNAKFDRVMLGKEFFTEAELRGYDLFFSEAGDCWHCHGNILFMNNELHNIGLDSVFEGENMGHYLISGNLFDMGKFKTPTLRNVALREGYMHDGRFQTLEEVIEHYNSGVLYSETLDPIMTKAGKEYGLQLTEKDKSDLVAFLKTLTDESFLTNKNLSNPF